MSALPVEPSSDTTSATIFVVDPDILVRMVIADYLRECGYRVVEGVNADDVLAVLEAGRKIDVILTEVQLAGSVDGFELARQIRENHPDIDVILTSGVTRAADKAGNLCDDGPVEKPYQSHEIVFPLPGREFHPLEASGLA
jgi:CheY-like chemotaxis protein